MGFTSTITRKMVMEDRRLHYGTFTNTEGATGGNITTDLHTIDFLIVQLTGTTTGNAPTANETFPCDDPVTIVTPANASGIWVAVGL